MSEDDVRKIRAAYEHFNETHEADYGVLHPDVEWHTARDLPDSATYRGPDRVAALFAEWAGTFDDFRAEPEDIIDSAGYVVVVVRLRGQPHGSSDAVELDLTQVWKMTDGKAIEVREYRTRAEGLNAAGIAP